MLNTLGGISWLGIALATMASFILGGVWFTALFGKAYSAALGRAHDPSTKPRLIFILGPLIWSLVTAVTTAILMKALGIETLGEAFEFGVFIGVGFLAATTINTGINPNIPNHRHYGLISGAYHVSAAVVMAVVLVMIK